MFITMFALNELWDFVTDHFFICYFDYFIYFYIIDYISINIYIIAIEIIIYL
jgi:hypothetical protein